MTNMKRITIKKAGLAPSLWHRIRQHALGSGFRVNASSADLYTFTPDADGKDWGGGWSWADNPKTWDGDLAVNLIDGKLYKLDQEPHSRLEYLRGEIEAERISYAEVAELQGLAKHINKNDVLLREWAGIPEGQN